METEKVGQGQCFSWLLRWTAWKGHDMVGDVVIMFEKKHVLKLPRASF